MAECHSKVLRHIYNISDRGMGLSPREKGSTGGDAERNGVGTLVTTTRSKRLSTEEELLRSPHIFGAEAYCVLKTEARGGWNAVGLLKRV